MEEYLVYKQFDITYAVLLFDHIIFRKVFPCNAKIICSFAALSAKTINEY